MPEQIQEHARRLRLIALIHHPLAAETGLSPQQNRILYTQEKQALAQVRRIIVTSPMTAAALQRDYAVPAEKLGVVIPGTDPAPLATGSQGANLNLICVATLTARKGHALLLKALAPLTNYPWQLNCVGSTVRDRKTALVVRNLCRTLGLQHKVRFSGELSPDQLKAAYRQADAFVLASYYEGYGMALSEALAYGLPVIATAGGAIAETVPHDAGLLSPVGDRQRLNRSLQQLLMRPQLRQRLAAGARRARRDLADWSESGHRFAGELDKVEPA
jgi:glycosyltransferase involved in cell wall biosynthesis